MHHNNSFKQLLTCRILKFTHFVFKMLPIIVEINKLQVHQCNSIKSTYFQGGYIFLNKINEKMKNVNDK